MSAHLEPIGFDGQNSSSTPLVLIHDGGGTIFQYCLLGPFNRPVYAIANPYFDEGGKPEGGIPQLAREYARAIQRDIGHGDIVLGGWSFGGTLSVEIARLLQLSDTIRVDGLLMIDSMCPWSDNYRMRGRVRPTYRQNTPEMVKVRVNRSFDSARDMMHGWERPPAYDAPPAVMISASQRIPTKNCPDGMPITGTPNAQLGWAAYPSLQFAAITKMSGDHFSMFADEKLRDMTDSIEEACVLLGDQKPRFGATSARASLNVAHSDAARPMQTMVGLVA